MAITAYLKGQRMDLWELQVKEVATEEEESINIKWGFKRNIGLPKKG